MNSKQLIRHTLQSIKEEHQIAICKRTGISIGISIAPTPGLFFDYPHPFSIYANAVELAELPYKTVSKQYSNELVAGCFLTVFTEHKLLSDQLSAPHRNLVLQSVPSFILIDAIRFIVSLNKREITWLPKLSLHDVVEQPLPALPLTESIRYYINECKAIVTPQTVKEKTATEKDNHREYTVKILASKLGTNKPGKNEVSNKLIIKENKETFKELLKEIVADSLLSKKMISLLRQVAADSNLQALHPEMRAKFTKVLSATDHPIVEALTKIINHSVYSKLTIVDDFERAISDSEEYQPKTAAKVTIAMILEAKRLGVPVSHLQQPAIAEVPVQKEETIIEEIEAATDIEVVYDNYVTNDGLSDDLADYAENVHRTKDLVDEIAYVTTGGYDDI